MCQDRMVRADNTGITIARYGFFGAAKTRYNRPTAHIGTHALARVGRGLAGRVYESDARHGCVSPFEVSRASS